MGNVANKDQFNKCVICKTACDGRNCNRCLNIIKDIKNLKYSNMEGTQLILNVMRLPKLHKNRFDMNCKVCKICPIYIFMSNACLSCGVKLMLDQISKNNDIKLVYTSNMKIENIIFDERYADILMPMI